jgi:mono/diheme cytochrome c family protein
VRSTQHHSPSVVAFLPLALLDEFMSKIPAHSKLCCRQSAPPRKRGGCVATTNLPAGWLIPLALAIFGTHTAVLGAQTTAGTLKLDTGKRIYESGCVSCHGPDGKGQSQNLAGFERPSTFPDFSDCATATPEPDIQWRAVITNGGPARAFSQIMPSFKDLLTQDQIGNLIDHLRSRCTEKAWPRGNLNLPRAMITEKAFPENETVITGSFNAQGAPGVGSTVIYEKRIGASSMMEAIIPFDFTHERGTWGAAFGDLALGYKQKLFHSLQKGSIFSVGGELIVPTGNTVLGTGGASTVFEGFAAYGQLLSLAA